MTWTYTVHLASRGARGISGWCVSRSAGMQAFGRPPVRCVYVHVRPSACTVGGESDFATHLCCSVGRLGCSVVLGVPWRGVWGGSHNISEQRVDRGFHDALHILDWKHIIGLKLHLPSNRSFAGYCLVLNAAGRVLVLSPPSVQNKYHRCEK